MLYNVGDRAIISENGLITTVGYKIGGKTTFAFEGSVFNAGSAVQWLRDELDFFNDSAESEYLAKRVPDNGGVYFVPAFTGLGAPYWRSDARATFTGISRGTNKNHLTRAVLESIAYSAKDLAVNMCRDSGIEISEIGCDGGAAVNNFLMQFQADVLGVKLVRPVEKESTALGAAYLACLALGIYGEEDIEKHRAAEREFIPSADREKYERQYGEYKKAVEKCLLK